MYAVTVTMCFGLLVSGKHNDPTVANAAFGDNVVGQMLHFAHLAAQDAHL